MDQLKIIKQSADNIISAAGALIDAYEMLQPAKANKKARVDSDEEPPVTVALIVGELDDMTQQINDVLNA